MLQSLLPLFVGIALGALVGFAFSKEARSRAIKAAVLLSGMWSVIVLIGVSLIDAMAGGAHPNAPAIAAALFFAGTSITAVGVILLPLTNKVKAFLGRAFA